MSVNIHNATIRVADLLDETGRFNMNLYSTTYTGVESDHDQLNKLAYDDSGHTGFQPAGDYATSTELTTASGDIVSQIPSDFYSQALVDSKDVVLDAKIDTTSGTLQPQIDLKADDADVFHTNVPSEINGLSAKGTPIAADYLLLEDSANSFNKKKVPWSSLPGAGGGETNTASNLGAGEGVFYQKSTFDLEFKSIVGGDNVSLTSDNNTITISGGGTMETHGNEYHSPDFATVAALDNKYDKAGGLISGDVTIQGDLTVTGTKFIANVEEVLVEDNLIVLNYGEPGAGVTAGEAGVEIDRGSETNYQFMFVEATDNFQIGISGSLQAVATREDSPTDTFVPYWNDSQTRFDTAGSIAYSDIASESYVDTVSGTLIGSVVEDTTPQLGGDLDLNEKYIELTPVPASDQTASGDMAIMTVDVNATGIGAALHLDTDGNYIEADASGAVTMPCMAMALEAGTGSKKVLLSGFMRDDSWAWTVGGELFVSETTGALTQTAPTTSSGCVQPVGIATHADRIWFKPVYGYVEVKA